MATDFIITCIQPVGSYDATVQWQPKLGATYQVFARGYFNNIQNLSFSEVAIDSITNSHARIEGCLPNHEIQVFAKRWLDGETNSNSLTIKNAPLAPTIEATTILYHSAAIVVTTDASVNQVLLYNTNNELIAMLGLEHKNINNQFVYNWTNLITDTEYSCYAVCSSHTNVIENRSEPSLVLTFKTFLQPIAPTTILIEAITDQSCIIKWASSDAAICYQIFLNNEMLAETTDTTYIIRNLLPNTTYTGYLKLIDAISSIDSAAFSFTTQMAAVDSLELSDVGTNYIKVTTLPIAGATAYNFYQDLQFIATSPVPSFTYSNLNAGQGYQFAVAAIKDGLETAAATLFAYTLVAPPEQVWITNVLHNSARLGWSSVNGVTAYRVYQIQSGQYNLVAETQGTAYNIQYLAPVTSYVFVVTSVRHTIESIKSGQATFTTLPPVPAAPKDLLITSPDVSELRLQWGQVYDYGEPLTYRIYLSNNLYATTSDNFIIITGLQANTTYLMSVSAVNAAGESERSYNIYGKTMPNLTPPQDIVATAVSVSEINIVWTAVIGATEYIVIINGVEYNTVNNTFTKIDAAKNTEYTIHVYAKNANGISDSSSVVVVKTPTGNPDVPENLIATPHSYSFDLTWDIVGDAYGYHVFVDGVEFKTESNQITVIKKQPNTTYLVEVQALATYGRSSSAVISVTTKLAAPELYAIAITQNTLEVGWEPVVNASQYKVVWLQTSPRVDESAIEVLETAIPATNNNRSLMTGLPTNTQYDLAIYAISDNGIVSDRSEVLVVSTLPDLSETPAALRKAIVQETSFQVIWSHSPRAITYNIYSNDELIHTVSAPVNFVDFDDVEPGALHNIQVAAVGIDGESPRSQILPVITKISSPQNITIEQLDIVTNITWDEIPHAVSYKIYYKTDISDINYSGTGLSLGENMLPVTSPILVSDFISSVTGRHGVQLYNFMPDISYWFAITAIGQDGHESIMARYKPVYIYQTPATEGDEL